jgi:hypothetical protein
LLSGPFSWELILASVTALFAENGHRAAPLFTNLPTSIFHAENWPLSTQEPLLSRAQARILFRLALRNIPNVDFQSINHFLRRYHDPWGRTGSELEEGLLTALVGAGESNHDFDLAGFEQWFDLVTNAEHVRSEQSNFGAAWQGAIENAHGRYRKQSGGEV